MQRRHRMTRLSFTRTWVQLFTVVVSSKAPELLPFAAGEERRLARTTRSSIAEVNLRSDPPKDRIQARGRSVHLSYPLKAHTPFSDVTGEILEDNRCSQLYFVVRERSIAPSSDQSHDERSPTSDSSTDSIVRFVCRGLPIYLPDHRATHVFPI